MPITILNPTFEGHSRSLALAPRLASLEGRTIGLLDNNKKNVGHFLGHVEDVLRADYGVSSFVRRVKSNTSTPVPADILRDLTKCDAVISAVGD